MAGKQEKKNLKASDFRKVELRKVELESMDGVVYLRRPPAALANYMWQKTGNKTSEEAVTIEADSEMGSAVVSLMVVDERGNRLFPSFSDVDEIPMDVYMELLTLAGEWINEEQKARGEGND